MQQQPAAVAQLSCALCLHPVCVILVGALLHLTVGLLAVLRTCCCLQALEQNYITFKALSLGHQQQQQQQAASGSIAALGGSDPQPAAAAAMDVSDAEDDDSDDDAGDMCLGSSGMAVDGEEAAAAAAAAGSNGGSSGRRGKSKVSPEFKELVMNVLIQNGFEQMRPAKMTQEDFLKLLADFNAAGIHFS
jgi:18S rRNA (adenine1779-N6/adenine1780-N6)-dimethyltransferase